MAARLFALLPGYGWYGVGVRLAEEFGVSEATVSRDIQAILRTINERPRRPTAADYDRAIARLDAEIAAERERLGLPPEEDWES